ncbi:hypothetical protein EV193_101663 [Herbihabitans rhizosphaerae]|uniref:Uncharacterized protein n=1 Tax=Herbihabitans rhizosphaerae TaxID=1872711 RepID=A0A4Q7L659_9PSEU|nr:hypothetical protein [Herbihabitans rhizosphaerae]RZS44784.1 hypothetical protein EV193_101663 [Herbihabitans rhizosphaerae]
MSLETALEDLLTFSDAMAETMDSIDASGEVAAPAGISDTTILGYADESKAVAEKWNKTVDYRLEDINKLSELVKGVGLGVLDVHEVYKTVEESNRDKFD